MRTPHTSSPCPSNSRTDPFVYLRDKVVSCVRANRRHGKREESAPSPRGSLRPLTQSESCAHVADGLGS